MNLFASGSNAHGQLSNGSVEDSHSFARCSFVETVELDDCKILNIACGANHTLLLLEHRRTGQTELLGSGDGAAGQLGSEGSSLIFKPIRLPQEYCCRLISAAWQTSYVVLSCKGKADLLISMGADDFGDLGTGRVKNKEQGFHYVKFDHLFGEPCPVISVESLSSGPRHVIATLNAVFADGSTQCLTVGWGASRHGQLGQIDSSIVSAPRIVSHVDGITSAALGSQHTVLLHASGRVLGMGSNRKGQLQGIQRAHDVRDVCCTWNGTYTVLDDHNVTATGSNNKGQLGRPITDSLEPGPVQFPFVPKTRRLIRIACGSEHILVLFLLHETSAKEVWGWGWNEHGNMGTGSIDDVVVPVRIWPQDNDAYEAVNVWAGAGTSWIETK